jgi:hypothetical protein
VTERYIKKVISSETSILGENFVVERDEGNYFQVSPGARWLYEMRPDGSMSKQHNMRFIKTIVWST